MTMLHTNQVEELMCVVSSLDRPALIRQFKSYRASFPVDFTPEFLSSTPLERLRHILVAMCLQHQRLPDCVESSAA
jgi:hypothetical protein